MGRRVRKRRKREIARPWLILACLIALLAGFLWVLLEKPWWLGIDSGPGTVPRSGPFVMPTKAPRAELQPMGYALSPTPDLDRMMELAREGGSTSVRFEMRWATIETSKGSYNWASADEYVRAAAREHLSLLIVVDTAPTWATGVDPGVTYANTYQPRRVADFADFVATVLRRYGTHGSFWAAHTELPKMTPVGVELWNEPNITRYWPTGPNPGWYTQMVKAAYVAAKRADKDIPIVVGALARHGAWNDSHCHGTLDSGSDAAATNPVNFLYKMYRSGLHGYFDAISVHPYTTKPGATIDTMLGYSLCSAWSQINDTPTSIRSLMKSNGDGDKQVWITEGGGQTCVPGATYGCISEADQALLATQQVALWKSYPWAGGYYWYELRDHGNAGKAPADDGEQHFGTLLVDGAKKPAYDALKAAFLR